MNALAVYSVFLYAAGMLQAVSGAALPRSIGKLHIDLQVELQKRSLESDSKLHRFCRKSITAPYS